MGRGATFFGFVGPPWLLLLVFRWFLLVPPCASGGSRLCVIGFPSAHVGEHTRLAPRPRVMLLWVVLEPVVSVLMRLLWVLVFMVLASPLQLAGRPGGGVESRCIGCVEHMLLLWM